MTIKRQIRLYILSIITIPLISLLAIYLFYYKTRPERALMDGSEAIEKLNILKYLDEDIYNLRKEIKDIPPDVEFLIIADQNEIILTNIETIKTEKKIEKKDSEQKEIEYEEFNVQDLFKWIEQSSTEYYYQLVSPKTTDTDKKLLVISRIAKFQRNEKKNNDNSILWMSLMIIFVEAFFIFIIFKLSTTISKSVYILETKTKRILSGDLDLNLEENLDKKNDNEITRLTNNLNKMRISLKENEQQKTRFIMGISHDLRSPVAVIKGYTEALKDEVITEKKEIQEALGLIESKASQLEGMIDTLISFVKLDTNEWRATLKNRNIYDFLNRYTISCQATAEVFKRNFSSELNLDHNYEIKFDSQLLERALENIFSNAIRYSNQNDSIHIKAYQDINNIYISIKDSGIGMEQEDLKKIFELFYRASSARQDGGMGIGLSIVKTIIDSHGWKIEVKSAKGKGTEFIVIIPLQIN